MLSAPDSVADHWQEFRPRPPVLKPVTMLRRMLWNPQWNENLFLVSLAERLMTVTTAETEAHSERELLLRVARHLHCHEACDAGAYLQIRLRFVSRNGPDHAVTSQIAYLSGAHLMAGLITP